MTEEDQLVQLCLKMGAAEAQARVMARQLSKRADQLVAERGITRVEAMAHLLKLVVEGSQGRTPEGFAATKPGAGQGSVN
ncbi:hypothetical protein [Nibricoccus sp. IMCC34717]|uniref:hypothetical protein n=1 Tax=Nibricoccus sp. IMCC34717 TaxID=3034021 RepID=UPI00385053AA